MRFADDEKPDSRTSPHPWYINRRFATYWSGSILSGFGDSIFEWTLALWAANVLGPQGAWVVVAILVAGSGPSILLGPLAGVFVDRWEDKGRTVLIAAVVSGILPLAIAPLLIQGGPVSVTAPVQITIMLTVVVVASIIAQVFRPASGIIVRDLVPAERRERSATLYQVSSSTTILIAPAIAAPLFAVFGIGWALIINGVSFLLAAVVYRAATRGMPRSPGSGPAFTPDGAGQSVAGSVAALRREFRTGIAFVRTSPTVSALVIAIATGMGGFGVWSALDVFFFLETLGGSNAAYGLLGVAQGAGELIGAVIMIRLIDRLGSARLLWSGLLFVGLIIVGYGLLPNVPSAIVACFVLGLGIPSLNVVIGPMVMRVTPRYLLGRVLGTVNPIASGALLLGASVGGGLYTAIGPTLHAGALGNADTLRVLISISGGVVLVASVIVWVRLGRLDAREEQERAAGAS